MNTGSEAGNKANKITEDKRKVSPVHSASARGTYIVDLEQRRNGRAATWKQIQVLVHTSEVKSVWKTKGMEKGVKEWSTEKVKSAVETTPV